MYRLLRAFLHESRIHLRNEFHMRNRFHLQLTYIFFLLVCQMAGVISAARAEYLFQQDSGTQKIVSIEAENYNDSMAASDSHEWQPTSGSIYSGGEAMEALPEDKINWSTGYATEGARLDYEVEFVATGTHYIWVRGLGPSTSSDSLHVGIDGNAVSTGENVNGFLPTGKLVWSGKSDASVRKLTVATTGVHTINVWMRESGMVFDKLVLTTASSYVPTGTGPAESVPTVAAPVISPGGGTYSDAVTVTLATATAGAEMYYTVDGATPVRDSTLYNNPFVLEESAVVKAAAFLDGYKDSAMASADFAIGSQQDPFRQDGGSQKIVSIEAENYNDSTAASDGHEWQPASGSLYSGGEAMAALPEDKINWSTGFAADGARLDYEVSFSATGTHYIWVRGLGPNTSSDSLHVGIDGAAVRTGENFNGFLPTGKLVWSGKSDASVRKLTVATTGVHTINVWMRESGMVFDKLVLTTDAAYVPTGAGPPESPTTAEIWPTHGWLTATPEEMGMNRPLLEQARAYALLGGGSGFITRGGKLVMSWGSATQLYDIKSTTKSIGVTALGLALKDGLVNMNDLAQKYLPGVGVPPESNAATGWLEKITLQNLATHTAGFDKTGGYGYLLFKPGTAWAYSDGGANWLADVMTVVFKKDLNTVMFNRVFSFLGIGTSELTWRSNAYREVTLNGIKRREFGAGITTNVNAMARIGYLYLRGGKWEGQQIIQGDFVGAAGTTPTQIAGLPVVNDTDLKFAGAPRHYGFLWWNNADGALSKVPRDAFWSWGLGDSLIVVIPSLDIVASRAGSAWPGNRSPNFFAVLRPFIEPTALSASAGQ